MRLYLLKKGVGNKMDYSITRRPKKNLPIERAIRVLEYGSNLKRDYRSRILKIVNDLENKGLRDKYLSRINNIKITESLVIETSSKIKEVKIKEGKLSELVEDIEKGLVELRKLKNVRSADALDMDERVHDLIENLPNELMVQYLKKYEEAYQ